MSRDARVRAYFKGSAREKLDSRGIGIVFLGGLLLLVSVSMYTSSGSFSGGCAVVFVIPGTVMGLWGGGRLWKAHADRRRWRNESAAAPQDDEVQHWLDDGLARVKDNALRALGLSESELVSDPLTIVAPVLWPISGIVQADLTYCKGRDGQARFGVYAVAVIALTDRHLGAYRCDYSFLEDRTFNEKTCEYHYQDIISVSTSEVPSSLSLSSGQELTAVQEFRVSVPNGEAIRITVDVPELRRMTGADSFPASGAEKAVAAIRAMLRHKKA